MFRGVGLPGVNGSSGPTLLGGENWFGSFFKLVDDTGGAVSDGAWLNGNFQEDVLLLGNGVLGDRDIDDKGVARHSAAGSFNLSTKPTGGVAESTDGLPGFGVGGSSGFEFTRDSPSRSAWRESITTPIGGRISGGSKVVDSGRSARSLVCNWC